MKTIQELKNYLSTLQNVPNEYRIAVGAMIFDAEGRVILIERGKKARDEIGKLEGVGGETVQKWVRKKSNYAILDYLNNQLN